MVCDLEEIKSFLKLKGVDTEEMTDEQLYSLVEAKLQKIEAETGRELHETQHTDYELHFYGQEYNLKHFPVVQIESLFYNDKLIKADEYILDKNNGIIKFKKPCRKCELLQVEYSSKESDYFIQTRIMSLVNDMILLDLSNDPAMGAASVKEGDVSINYDVSNSLNVLILRKLEHLRVRPLTRML